MAVRLISTETIYAFPTTHPAFAKLRDYQRKALRKAVDKEWGRIALATNAGKGAVIALLAEFAATIGVPVLILCDELAVFDALEGELEEWAGIIPGRVGQGVRTPPSDPVVLAMVPTLARRLRARAGQRSGPAKAKALEWCNWVGERGMLLLDEADKATAKGWQRILANAKGSQWRLGFSGTFPDPKEKPYDDLRLDELMGPILIKARNIDLVERGISAIPQVELRSYNATDALMASIPKMREWWKLPGPARRQSVYEYAITFNLDRHLFITNLIRPDTPTAIIVNRVAHGQALSEVLPDAAFLDGSCSPTERKEVLEQFQSGALKVLIITKILDRGTNRLGIAADILFVSGEGSSRQTLQRLGRGLRRTGGKEYLRLVDIIDRVDKDVAPKSRYLAKGAKLIHTSARKRIQLYHDEGFAVEVIQ